MLLGSRAATGVAALPRVNLWQTTPDPMYRISKRPDIKFGPDFEHDGVTVDISETAGHAIVGFGGTFTDGAAELFDSLEADQQDALIEAYFGESGIGYTVGRLPINSNDVSSESYSFDDTEGDASLEDFDDSLARAAEHVIPLALRAKEAAARQGRQLKLIASPWSPPSWMKESGDMAKSGERCLREGMEDVWASYISRWVKDMVDKGVPVWGVTPQNEPFGRVPWEHCRFTAKEMADFVTNSLGPRLKKEHPDLKLFIHDDNKDGVLDTVNATLIASQGIQYVSGVAFHWFVGDRFDVVAQIHSEFPDAMLLGTGATWPFEDDNQRNDEDFHYSGKWAHGVGFAHDIIGDLNAGTAGWIDWNLVLEPDGGENRKKNFCDSAIVAERGGKIVFHPQFYFIGHFSKFVLPDSVHLTTTVLNNFGNGHNDDRGFGWCDGDDGLQATSFQRPDGLIALVVLNCWDGPVGFKIACLGQAAQASIPPLAIQTYLLPSDMKATAPPRVAWDTEKLPLEAAPAADAWGSRALLVRMYPRRGLAGSLAWIGAGLVVAAAARGAAVALWQKWLTREEGELPLMH